MSRLKKILIFLGAICVVIAILVVVSYQHWWLKSVGSALFLDGKYSEQATIFRNGEGDFLISTNEPDDGVLYVYSSSNKDIGVPNASQFIFFGFCAYNRDLPVPVVSSSNRVKIEIDMNVSEQDEWVEFIALDGRRIKLYRSKL